MGLESRIDILILDNYCQFYNLISYFGLDWEKKNVDGKVAVPVVVQETKCT